TVTGTWPAAAEFLVDDMLWVSAELFDVEAPATLGEPFDYLQGPLSNRGLDSTVLLRDAADIGFTTFVLSPANVEVEVGHSQTFMVVLPFDAPPDGAVVALTVDPIGLLTGPGSVVVPESQRLTSVAFLAG